MYLLKVYAEITRARRDGGMSKTVKLIDRRTLWGDGHDEAVSQAQSLVSCTPGERRFAVLRDSDGEEIWRGGPLVASAAA